jgi:hypothetical protein
VTPRPKKPKPSVLRGRHEVPWWVLTAAGFLLIAVLVVRHALRPERHSDHFTMEGMALGAMMAGAKSVKDSVGRWKRYRREQTDAYEAAR